MPALITSPEIAPVRKEAPTVIGPTNKTPIRPTTSLPQEMIDVARATPAVEFDPEKHLCFKPPERVYTMKEWGYENQGISPIAGSDPFPLFTEEAVRQARRELFSESVLQTRQFASSFTKNMIRGCSRE